MESDNKKAARERYERLQRSIRANTGDEMEEVEKPVPLNLPGTNILRRDPEREANWKIEADVQRSLDGQTPKMPEAPMSPEEMQRKEQMEMRMKVLQEIANRGSKEVPDYLKKY